MPRPRVVMRKIREVLRLTLGERLSQRRVRQITGVPEATIYDYLKRAAAAGLAVWPLPKEVDDRELERRMFVSAGPPPLTRPLPDWTYVKKELRRKGVTLQLLHLEYLEEHPDGYQYSQFCRHYHAGVGAWMWCSGRTTWRGKRCSSTSPARPSPSTTARPRPW